MSWRFWTCSIVARHLARSRFRSYGAQPRRRRRGAQWPDGVSGDSRTSDVSIFMCSGGVCWILVMFDVMTHLLCWILICWIVMCMLHFLYVGFGDSPAMEAVVRRSIDDQVQRKDTSSSTPRTHRWCLVTWPQYQIDRGWSIYFQDRHVSLNVQLTSEQTTVTICVPGVWIICVRAGCGAAVHVLGSWALGQPERGNLRHVSQHPI
jgi:hypothetical protein